MGYERGTIFIYEDTFWLFEDYSTDDQMRQTFILRGLYGVQIEALASECAFLISPSDVDEEYVKGMLEE